MNWNEAAFGRDDGILCEVDHCSLTGKPTKPCGAKTWVTDDQGYGYVTYECDRGHTFAVQYDYEPDDHEPDCICYECCQNDEWIELPEEAFMQPKTGETN